VIIGIAVITVFAGLGVHYKGTATQRSLADLDQVVRNYSESVVDEPYAQCATAYSSVTVPAGYALVGSPMIRYWNGDNPATFSATCTTDRGVQRVSVTIEQSNSKQRDEVVVAKTESDS
jgi:hypothetical protein